MSTSWPNQKLREVAEIRVSNVDKKTHPCEIPVKLCNYMDVYSNEYVTGRIDFMNASATPAEIDRFGLMAGDVVITKDSETPDDIGVPAAIVDEIPNLVCGYHLALIRPDKEKLDSVYLAKQLSTSQVSRFFAVLASGSTRYGLSVSAIENVEIPVPKKTEQSKIAEILSTVDRAIEQTQALIAKQQRIKTGLMQDLLTRGIDEHGNLRSEETHEFKDSPLGRIPVEWVFCQICSVLSGSPKNGFSPVESDSWQGTYMLGLSCLTINGFVPLQLKYAPPVTKQFEKAFLRPGDFLISRSNTRELVGLVGIYKSIGVPCIYPDLMVRLSFSDEVLTEYMEQVFMSASLRRQIENVATGTSGSMVKINSEQIKNFFFAKPPIEEQHVILGKLRAMDSHLKNIQIFREKLCSLKTALMQDLLSGKVRVTPLLEKAEVSS